MPFLIPIAAKISIALTLVIALFSSGLYVGNRLGISSCQEAVIESQRHSLEVSAKQSQISDSVTTKYVDRIKIVQGSTREIIKEIKVYVKDDADTYLSGGFRLLHDSAIYNELPGSTRIADAETISVEAVAQTVIENYQACNVNSETLSSLQSWVKEQSAIR